jgi:hypothetical protein
VTEAQDHRTLLRALSRIHRFPPPCAVQPKAPKRTTFSSWGSGGDGNVKGQGRRGGGVLSLLKSFLEGEVWR